MVSKFSWKRVLAAALGLFAGSSLHASEDPAAIVRQDASTVKASGREMPGATILSRGQPVTIVAELSNDRRVYVSTGTGGGWIERSALVWPDGTPVLEAESLDDEDADGAVPAAVGPERVAAGAVVVTPIGFVGGARKGGRSSNPGLSELLLRLVADVPVMDYASAVVKDHEMSRDEKVQALKIYYKYLQEKRSKMRTGGPEGDAERMALEWQSEDLLANLAKLDSKDSAGRAEGKQLVSGGRRTGPRVRKQKKLSDSSKLPGDLPVGSG